MFASFGAHYSKTSLLFESAVMKQCLPTVTYTCQNSVGLPFTFSHTITRIWSVASKHGHVTDNFIVLKYSCRILNSHYVVYLRYQLFRAVLLGRRLSPYHIEIIAGVVTVNKGANVLFMLI